MLMRKLSAICLFGLLLTACQSATTVPTPNFSSGGGKPIYEDIWSDGFEAQVEWNECTFQAYQSQPQCGFITVPENYSDPKNGETMRLAFALYKTRNTEPAIDPLILVVGMPLTEQSGFLPYLFEDVYKKRDLLVFDLRGTGMSGNELVCPGIDSAAWEALPNGGLTPEDWGRLHEDCRQAMENQQVNLDAYSLSNMANDLKAVRLAFGYTKWNIFSVEPLGAYLAYEQLHIDPEGIRSLTLDSIAPNYSGQPTDFNAADQVLSEVFTLCGQDEKCNDMFPNLEKVFYSVVDQLNANPMKIVAYDTSGGRRAEVLVDGNYLVDLTLNIVMSGQIESVGHLPRMIYQVQDGNDGVLAKMAGDLLANTSATYNGMYSLIMCRQFPYPDENAVNVATSSLPLALSSYFDEVTKSNRAICEAWSPLPTTLPTDPGASFAPVLLFNGGWNWQWSADGDVEKFMKSAPDAQVVTLPMAGQFNFFTRNVMGCTQTMFNAFIENPEVQVDTSCVPTERPITWITMR